MKGVWHCSRCRYAGPLVPTRIGERLGTTIGGILGSAIGFCAFDRKPLPLPKNYRGLVSGLMVGASTGNQIGQILDTYLLRIYRCPRCKKLIIF